jgi:hypothetical protein
MEPYSFNPPPRNLSITLALLDDLGWTTIAVPDCGDPNNSGTITATDAQLVLRGAVGATECPGYLCNVNLMDNVTASDALLVLRRAVGQDLPLTCPLA